MPEQGPARRFVVRGGARRTPFRGVCPHYSGSCAGMQGGGAAGARIHKLLNSDSYMGRFAAGRQTGNGPVPRQTRQGTGPFHPPAPPGSASGVTPAADKNSLCPAGRAEAVFVWQGRTRGGVSASRELVEVTGLEPAASWSQTRRATSCATPRGHRLIIAGKLRSVKMAVSLRECQAELFQYCWGASSPFITRSAPWARASSSSSPG